MNDQSGTGWPDFPALMICLSIAYLINECPVRMSPRGGRRGGGIRRFPLVEIDEGEESSSLLASLAFRFVSFSPFFHADNLIVSIPCERRVKSWRVEFLCSINRVMKDIGFHYFKRYRCSNILFHLLIPFLKNKSEANFKKFFRIQDPFLDPFNVQGIIFSHVKLRWINRWIM